MTYLTKTEYANRIEAWKRRTFDADILACPYVQYSYNVSEDKGNAVCMVSAVDCCVFKGDRR